MEAKLGINDTLALSEGDKLEFSLDDAGLIVVRPRPADTPCGILGDFALDQPITVDVMKEVVRWRAADAVSDRY